MLDLGSAKCCQNVIDEFATVLGPQIVRNFAVSTGPELWVALEVLVTLGSSLEEMKPVAVHEKLAKYTN